MRNLIILVLAIFVTSIGIVAQPVDPKASIGGLSQGSIAKTELVKVGKIIPSQADIVIVSFTMSYPIGEDDFAEFVSQTADLTQEMKDSITQLTAGTEVSFENIKAKRGDKILILEAITLKIKD